MSKYTIHAEGRTFDVADSKVAESYSKSGHKVTAKVSE